MKDNFEFNCLFLKILLPDDLDSSLSIGCAIISSNLTLYSSNLAFEINFFS